MKVFFTALSIVGLVLIGGLISCEGPEGPGGPAGPTGPVGAAGPAGPAGADGIAGTTNCAMCHVGQNIAEKIFQYEKSTHYLGGQYVRGESARCAPCHSSQGFLEVLEFGGTETDEGIVGPLPPNCYTCHKIHQTYTSADWENTKTEAIPFWVTGETIDLGVGNQCVGCHQSRLVSPPLNVPWDPMPPPLDSDTMIYVTTTRYGPHHGSQGLMFTGHGAAERSDVDFPTSSHFTLLQATGRACVQCHMAEYDARNNLGGHQFAVANEEGDLNTAGCIDCHTAEEAEMMVAETQAEVRAMLYELGGKLMEQGLLVDTTGSMAWRTIQDTFPSAHVGALYNALFVYEDMTLGVHNARYARKVLEESMKVLNE
ncbi:MAG: hypothetical protein OEM26_15110 [Saprospiraceae bacterium]|nr:hypothetical protein [Saprospiraceae bacterium]